MPDGLYGKKTPGSGMGLRLGLVNRTLVWASQMVAGIGDVPHNGKEAERVSVKAFRTKRPAPPGPHL